MGTLVAGLSACGGGSGGGSSSVVKVNAPKLAAKPSNCSATACTETFTVTQPGYQAGMKTALTLKLGSTKLGASTVTLNSAGIGTWSQANLTRGSTYTLTGVTSSGEATSPATTLNVVVPAVDPNAPSDLQTSSTCTAQESCTVSVSFNQAGAPSSLSVAAASGVSTTVSLYQHGNPTALATKTISPKATGNSVSFTNALSSGDHYFVDVISTIDGSSHASTTNFSPNYIYANGAYIYNTRDDLTGSDAAGYASSWQNDFKGLQLTDLYIQPFMGLNANTGGYTLPSAANYSSYQDYYDKTVLTTCTDPNSKTFSLAYFGYANAQYPKAGTCVPGSDITAAYKKWSLTSGVETRVMPIIVSPETMFKDSTSATTIDYLAHAVAQTIYADPSVAGATFDLEFHNGIPADPIILSDWFNFYSDLIKYIHQLAPAPSEQKYISVFANDAVLSKVQDNGVNMFALLGGNNPNCAVDKCYIIIPRYDFGGINPWNDYNTLQSLDQLVNDANPSRSFSYQAASGLSYKAPGGNSAASMLYTILQNKDYFQMAFAMSGSWGTWANSFMYRTAKASNPIVANSNVTITKTNTAPPAVNPALVPASGYDSYITQTANGQPIMQYDYVCDSLSTFQLVYTGKVPSGDLCSFVGDTSEMSHIAATWAGETNAVQKYFVGVTMYQISDITTDLHYCDLPNRFQNAACNIDVPADMNAMFKYNDSSNKYQDALNLVNAFTKSVMIPQTVTTVSS